MRKRRAVLLLRKYVLCTRCRKRKVRFVLGVLDKCCHKLLNFFKKLFARIQRLLTDKRSVLKNRVLCFFLASVTQPGFCLCAGTRLT